MIMALMLLELVLVMFQHGQEFAKSALGLGEVVVLMAHSLVVATPALASQNSALPCCALFQPHRNTISDGIKAIPSVIDVSPNQEHLVYLLEEKKKRNGAKSVKLWTLFNLVPISVPSDSSFYPARDLPDSLQPDMRPRNCSQSFALVPQH